jgi:hypothetical protein
MLFGIIMTIVLIAGCAAPGRYVIENPPTKATRSFTNIEVAKVEVGITKDELEPETQAELRTQIIEEIQKKEIFQKVAAEFDLQDGTLQIQPKIIEFSKGNQALRYFISFGAGKAHMDVECKFINKETGDVIAKGKFIGELSGGFFGGSAGQDKIGSYVARHIADFLKKGE